jgi:hypothetical protein
MLAGKVVQGRTVVVRRYATVRTVRDCHVLFVVEPDRRRMERILEVLSSRPILTVSDLPGFETKGMITLTRQDHRIGLRINLAATQEAGLHLSSRLLRLDKNLRPVVSQQAKAAADPPHLCR